MTVSCKQVRHNWWKNGTKEDILGPGQGSLYLRALWKLAVCLFSLILAGFVASQLSDCITWTSHTNCRHDSEETEQLLYPCKGMWEFKYIQTLGLRYEKAWKKAFINFFCWDHLTTLNHAINVLSSLLIREKLKGKEGFYSIHQCVW